MNKDNQIVVASIETLQELIANTVRAELALMEQRIKEVLPEKKPLSDRLYTKDVADYLNISRQTVHSYRKEGILPPPHFTDTNRAYWTREQIKETLKVSEHGWKYDL